MKFRSICALAIALIAVECRAALPEPIVAGLQRLKAEHCAAALAGAGFPGERVNGKLRRVLESAALKLGKSVMAASDRKELVRLLIESGERWNPDTYYRVIGMRFHEISREVSDSLKRQEDRFGGEDVWAWGDSMPTHDLGTFHELFAGVPLKAGETVVDIGAGFGNLGIYLAIMRPGVKFIGYEIVPERVAEFNRVAALLELGPDVRMVEQDLSREDFRLPLAEYYYSWLPTTEATGAKIWRDLEEKGQEHPFTWVFMGMKGGYPGPNGFVPGPGRLLYSAAKARELQR